MIGEKLPVVTLGYQSFVIEPDTLAQLLTASANGEVVEVSKTWIGSEYKASVKGPVGIQVEHLEIVPDKEGEIKRLREQLAKLEGNNG